jgi:hypothetical protein
MSLTPGNSVSMADVAHLTADQMAAARRAQAIRGSKMIGASIRFLNENDLQVQVSPETGQYSGNAFADFLLGDLAGDSYPIAPLSATPTNDRYGFFFQDDWKATPRLTLNMGLRYDLPTLYQNTQGNMANWYPNLNQVVLLKGQGQPALFPSLPVVAGSRLGLGSGNYIGTDDTQISPRFGLAYRALRSSRLVLRGGYGLYYTAVPWAFGSYELAVNPPFTGAKTFEPFAGSTPTLTFANPFPTGLGAVPSAPSASAYPTDYSYPMTGEWNFSVESQISPSKYGVARHLPGN